MIISFKRVVLIGIVVIVAFKIVGSIFAPNVLILGDSLTKGPFVNKESRYIYLLADKLNFDVIDLSENGMTSEEGLEKFKVYVDENGLSVDALFLELGANDYLRRLDLNEAKNNLQEIIDISKKYNVPVLLLGLDEESRYVNVDIFEDLSSKNNIPLIDNILQGVERKPELLLSDGLHPNYKGHKVMFENMVEDVSEFMSTID